MAPDIAQALQALAQRLDELEARHAAELDLAYERFTSVQKLALSGVAEAREQAAFWRSEFERVKRDAYLRAEGFQQAMVLAQREALALREALESSVPAGGNGQKRAVTAAAPSAQPSWAPEQPAARAALDEHPTGGAEREDAPDEDFEPVYEPAEPSSRRTF